MEKSLYLSFSALVYSLSLPFCLFETKKEEQHFSVIFVLEFLLILYFILFIVSQTDKKMKLLSIAVLRYNGDTPEPVLLVQSCELSSFGFFQRGT